MQTERNFATATPVKGDQYESVQPIPQEKEALPVHAKYTASSESSSETNVESEHADIIGTPLMTATTSESGVQVGDLEEEKVEEKEISSKDEGKVSLGNDAPVGGVSVTNKQLQSREKKSFSLPEKVIRYAALLFNPRKQFKDLTYDLSVF